MGKTILVIDDDAADAKRIMTILGKEGYTVIGASTPEEALRKTRETSPDLVIADVVMGASNTTGFDMCRKIKEAFQPNPPRVLMVTGKVAGVNISLAKQMGADAFEAKTLNMAHVVKTVREILS